MTDHLAPRQQAEPEPEPESERVDFCVANDESARRIEAVLGALGYRVVRDRAELDGDLFEEAAEHAACRYRLSRRERQVLALLLRGVPREQIVEQLHFSRQTLEWHLHNIYTKLGVTGSEQALRRALHIDGAARWLRAPRLHREALELLELAGTELLAALRSESSTRVTQASAVLDDVLRRARRLAGLNDASIDLSSMNH